MINIVRAKIQDAELLSSTSKVEYLDEGRRFDPKYNGEKYENPTVKDILSDIKRFMYFKILINTGIIVGHNIDKIDNSHFQIKDFCIHLDYQNKRIGKQTLKILENMFQLVKLWTLETPIYSIRSQHLFKVFGYKKIGMVM